jgi:Zn-finger nucleic acid-binding protein
MSGGAKADTRTVDTANPLCPGCSGKLMVNPVEGFRHYLCASCGGTVITIAVLRQLAVHVAQQVWTEEPSASPGTGRARCPFCTQEMQPKAVPNGSAATCRPCEAVWLDKDAADNLTVKAPPEGSQPTLSSEALKCPQCGAPVANSWAENCQYCGASLHAPTKVVVLPEELAGEYSESTRFGRPAPLGGVVGGVLGALLRGRR